MPTDKQLQASRENAQHSTGPRTEEGKARSSMNAVKTGLTGRTVLLPGDDVAAYREHLACLEERHKPANDAENMLVQSVADIEWRLARIPSLEAGIYAIGRMELENQFTHEEDAAVRRMLADAKVFLTYQRQLNNLSIQESRLRRQREKDLAELKRLQAERAAQRPEIPAPSPPRPSNLLGSIFHPASIICAAPLPVANSARLPKPSAICPRSIRSTARTKTLSLNRKPPNTVRNADHAPLVSVSY